jgi:hypothetical protein
VTGATTLLFTPLFVADQAAMALGCPLGIAAACRTPPWVAPAELATWAGVWITAPLALTAAARAVRSGQRPWLARLAILAAVACAGAWIVMTLHWNVGDAPALPPSD